MRAANDGADCQSIGQTGMHLRRGRRISGEIDEGYSTRQIRQRGNIAIVMDRDVQVQTFEEADIARRGERDGLAVIPFQ